MAKTIDSDSSATVVACSRYGRLRVSLGTGPGRGRARLKSVIARLPLSSKCCPSAEVLSRFTPGIWRSVWHAYRRGARLRIPAPRDDAALERPSPREAWGYFKVYESSPRNGRITKVWFAKY